MKKVAVVAGGFSGEKVISHRSAGMVMDHIDRSRFQPTLVHLDQKGWYAMEDDEKYPINKNDFSYERDGQHHTFDVVFVMIHGTPGEDGILQGYFDLLNLPYTTGGVLTMSMTFNKGVTNDYLREKGYNTALSVVLKEGMNYDPQEIASKTGIPCFVKPNCGGSSIATSRVNDIHELRAAIEKAFTADKEVIIESFISGREVTCGVISKEGTPMALPLTEIITENEFFDFDAKYEGQSQEITPAEIDDDLAKEVQQISEELYEVLHCKGMIRIDFLLPENGIYIIEVNTVPGFSAQSLIPQQAAAMGISKTELISMILDETLK